MIRHTFSKEERLSGKRLIDDLFKDGSSFFIYPYRVLYKRHEGAGPKPQVLLSVSKRRFRRAVHRNLLKRRMRESYRLQKNDLLQAALQEPSIGLIIAIQYVSKEVLDFALIQSKMANVLEKLRSEAI